MKKRFWKNSSSNKKLKFLIPLIFILVLIIVIVPSVYFVNTLQKEKIEKEFGLISEKTTIASEQLITSPEKENFFLNTLNNLISFFKMLVEVPVAAISCTTDANCPTGQVCAHGNCVLAVEAPCTIATEDTDCPDGQQCGDGICVPGCLTNDQCGGGLICNGHSCVGCCEGGCCATCDPNIGTCPCPGYVCAPGSIPGQYGCVKNVPACLPQGCWGPCDWLPCDPSLPIGSPSAGGMGPSACPVDPLCVAGTTEACSIGGTRTCNPSGKDWSPCSGSCSVLGSTNICNGVGMQVCSSCACTPDCTGKVCGDDGCGGSCGSCDDGIACTTDSCDPATSTCLHPLTGCDDSNLCTTDTCNADGTCSNTAINCDDSDACTLDSCDPANGNCLHALMDCDDANLCNGLESCDSTIGCIPGTSLTCNDGNACTTDSCNPATGCVSSPIPNCGGGCTPNCAGKSCGSNGCGGSCGSCPSGDACTTYACANNKCKSTTKNCDDSNSCTDDSCSPAFGCVNTQKSCSDGDICTDDSCDSSTGNCIHIYDATNDASCTCIPSCNGNECGDDGCGGSCGGCSENQCCDNGKCIDEDASNPECCPEGYTKGLCPEPKEPKEPCQQSPRPLPKNLFNSLNPLNNFFSNLFNILKNWIIGSKPKPKPEPQYCCLGVCGNGKGDVGEECDDGNTESGDGCSSECIIEFCGDGIVNNNPKTSGDPCDKAEECDLGNGDSIKDESFGTCDGLPGVCDEVDEKGILISKPFCDGGDLVNNDEGPCTSDCQVAKCGDDILQTFGPDGMQCPKVPNPECLALGGDASTCDLVPIDGCDDEECEAPCEGPLCKLGLSETTLLAGGKPTCDGQCKNTLHCCVCKYQEMGCKRVNTEDLDTLKNNPFIITIRGHDFGGIIPKSKEEACINLRVPSPDNPLLLQKECVPIYDAAGNYKECKDRNEDKCDKYLYEDYPKNTRLVEDCKFGYKVKEDPNFPEKLDVDINGRCEHVKYVRFGHGTKPGSLAQSNMELCSKCTSMTVCSTSDVGCNTMGNLEEARSAARALWFDIKRRYYGPPPGPYTTLELSGNQATNAILKNGGSCPTSISFIIKPDQPIIEEFISCNYIGCNPGDILTSGFIPQITAASPVRFCVQAGESSICQTAPGNTKSLKCCPFLFYPNDYPASPPVSASLWVNDGDCGQITKGTITKAVNLEGCPIFQWRSLIDKAKNDALNDPNFLTAKTDCKNQGGEFYSKLKEQSVQGKQAFAILDWECVKPKIFDPNKPPKI
ncbi:MAG: hypothetical protein PHF67_02660 [Candidatus Nanoarchaeia archaeon]|nr:hypothetical protein [Candidatus Nanoarchaeia archaeon]